jgi:hypothetical protein
MRTIHLGTLALVWLLGACVAESTPAERASEAPRGEERSDAPPAPDADEDVGGPCSGVVIAASGEWLEVPVECAGPGIDQGDPPHDMPESRSLRSYER